MVNARKVVVGLALLLAGLGSHVGAQQETKEATEPRAGEARILVRNAQESRYDPKGDLWLVEIAALRVIQGIEPPDSFGNEARPNAARPATVNKVLGTVPAQSDGSAYFRVPARRPIRLQLLDPNGMAVMTMRSFVSLEPGETRSCVGCHEQREGEAPPSDLGDGRRQPDEIKPPPGQDYAGGFSFHRTVQPVLDRNCIDCHGLKQPPAADLDFTATPVRSTLPESLAWVAPGDLVPSSYQSLIGRQGLVKLAPASDEAGSNRPRRYYAAASQLIRMHRKEHNSLRLGREDLQRLIDWIDLNGQLYGDYMKDRVEYRDPDPAGERALREFLQERFGEKLAAQRFHALVNVALPRESWILEAPLSRAAGGWGLLTPSFTGRDDPAYARLLELVSNTSAGPLDEYVRVSPRDARYLELSDGRPYIPIGLNIVQPGWRGDSAERLATMERWLKALSDNGGNYVRVWLSADFWKIERQKAGVYDEEQAKHIDALLEMARRHGVRVKMTLEHFREIDPNSGYKNTWALEPLHHVSKDGTARSMKEWFEGEASRAQFRRKLAWYQERYGDQPIVYGWELWNEINAVRGRCDYMTWTRDMLGELRRLFPKNMVMQSLGSFDRDGQRDLYRRMSRMPGNDVAQVHRYLDLGAALEICHGPVDVLAADAVRELRAFEPNRPIILAESGAVEPRHTGPFKLYGKDKAGIILHDVIFAPFFAGAAGAGQCWHWDKYVDANGLWRQFNAFAKAVEGIDPPAEEFRPRVVDHPRLRIYALSGKRTTLLWLRDKRNTWRTELAEGKAPETVSGISLSLEDLELRSVGRLRAYDPWRDRWTDVKATNGKAGLPDFRRSLVLRALQRADQ